MKSVLGFIAAGQPIVALLVSAWIEIRNMVSIRVAEFVALLVSAWIEILRLIPTAAARSVALLVSAWIEMQDLFEAANRAQSHSS
ncbi:hypothetical protein BAVI_00865 [Neobacillus vireti LMG 21834]|uniref:Uncharacterized protein n=1 Tax=Neobacillus vireti LMG 21834 TaxID=1131730 RepID=A0AB94IUS6_9BACI|nr:hypothetical protein BAVI_00865 [Neobacillus vireti LMG 21834]